MLFRSLAVAVLMGCLSVGALAQKVDTILINEIGRAHV